MKFIEKSQSPLRFEEFKLRFEQRSRRAPMYLNLGSKVKRELKYSLLHDQGYLCCYCMKGITREASHIEHFLPRALGKQYPYDMMQNEIELGYNNLFCSCNGEHEDKSHCGHKKGALFPDTLLRPSDPHVEEHFAYMLTGEMRGKDEAGKETIKLLNLDSFELRRHRQAAIEASGYYDEYFEEDREEILEFFSSRDRSGRFQPYCVAVLYVVNNG